MNEEAGTAASSFSVYLSVRLQTLDPNTKAADLEVIVNSLVGVLEVQYGIFVPKNSIKVRCETVSVCNSTLCSLNLNLCITSFSHQKKGITFEDVGPQQVLMVVEMAFDSLHTAEDSEAVMRKVPYNSYYPYYPY